MRACILTELCYAALTIATLLKVLEDIPFSAACDRHDLPKTYTPLAVQHVFENRVVTQAMQEAQDQARKYMTQTRMAPNKPAKLPKVRPLDASEFFDQLAMKAAMAAAFECYGPCPFLPFGAVLMDKTTGDLLMHSCNTVYLDATNHAEMNAFQLAAHYYPNRSFDWWNNVILYTTAEPCPMCMAAARWIGIGEIVYGTSIATQTRYGWNGINVTAPFINQQSQALSTRTLLNGPFFTSFTDPYFAWQYNVTNPCPPFCRRNPSSNICIPDFG